MITTARRPTILTPADLRRQTQRTGLGTICLFRGPTQWVDPARKLMTPLSPDIRPMDDLGNKVQWWDAGMVHRAIMDELGTRHLCTGIGNACGLIHDPTQQYSRDGLKVRHLHTEALEERYLRRVPEWFGKVMTFESNQVDPFRDEPLSRIDTGFHLENAPPGLWMSPSLFEEVGQAFDLSAFPASWDFGNGTTCNSYVPLCLSDGTQRPTLLCWVMLDPALVDRYGADPVFWRRLREIVEGGQIGNYAPCREVEAVQECQHEWAPIAFSTGPTLRKAANVQVCLRCEAALKVGEHSVIIEANHVQVTTAVAPANPGAGTVRWYSTSDTATAMRSSGGTETAFGGTTGAVTVAGSTLTEASTTSTTAVDLQTVTVSVAANLALLITTDYRKSAGAAFAAGGGLKLNTTVLGTSYSTANDSGNVCGGTTATDRAENGYAQCVCGGVVTSYTFQGAFGQYTWWTSAGGTSAITSSGTADGIRPNATLTSVIGRGITGSALVTWALNETVAYAMARS